MEKKEKLKTSTFYHYAEEYRKHITEEEEIEKINMTKEFWKELQATIKAGELINININGQVSWENINEKQPENKNNKKENKENYTEKLMRKLKE